MARYAILIGIDLLDGVVKTEEIASLRVDPSGKNVPKSRVRTIAHVVERFSMVDTGFDMGEDALEGTLKTWGPAPVDETCRQILSVVSKLSAESGLGELPWPIVEQMLGFDSDIRAIVETAGRRDEALKAAGSDAVAQKVAKVEFEAATLRHCHTLEERAEHWGYWATGLRAAGDSPSDLFQELLIHLLRFMAYDEIQWMRAEVVGRGDEAALIADEDYADAVAAARRSLMASKKALEDLEAFRALPSLGIFLAGNDMLLSAFRVPRGETIGDDGLCDKWNELCMVESADAASWCGMTSRLLRGLIEYAGYANHLQDSLRLWERLKLRDKRFVKDGPTLQPASWQPDLDALDKDPLCVDVFNTIVDYETFITGRSPEEPPDHRVDAYVKDRKIVRKRLSQASDKA